LKHDQSKDHQVGLILQQNIKGGESEDYGI